MPTPAPGVPAAPAEKLTGGGPGTQSRPGLAASSPERIEIEILNESKVIEGVETAIYLDKVYSNGQLIEEARDYLAQHKNGDVWCFGEDVNNFLQEFYLIIQAVSFMEKTAQKPEFG